MQFVLEMVKVSELFKKSSTHMSIPVILGDFLAFANFIKYKYQNDVSILYLKTKICACVSVCVLVLGISPNPHNFKDPFLE